MSHAMLSKAHFSSPRVVRYTLRGKAGVDSNVEFEKDWERELGDGHAEKFPSGLHLIYERSMTTMHATGHVIANVSY